MAEKTTTTYVCDIDGTPDAEYPETTFGLDGVEYEIDLSAAQRERLVDLLSEFTANARRVGGRRKSVTPNRPPRQVVTPIDAAQDMRKWAQEHAGEYGWAAPGDRGRLSAAIVEAYHAAHEPKAKAKVRAVKPVAAAAKATKAASKATPKFSATA